MTLPTTAFWDLELVNIDEIAWRQWLSKQVETKSERTQIIFTPNPEQLVLASRDPSFHDYLRQADYLIPDGVGLVWASGVRARLTGVDSVAALLRACRDAGQPVLAIGSRHPSNGNRLTLKIGDDEYVIYYTPGYQDAHAPTAAEERAVADLLAQVRPAVVLVALGAPAQERWIMEHRELLDRAGAHLALGIGGSLDFLAGTLRRAPVGWQRLGLEWLYRLLQEPWRWRRQLALVDFVVKKITGFWRTVQKTPRPVNHK